MRYCPACGSQVTDFATFCSKCGASLPEQKVVQNPGQGYQNGQNQNGQYGQYGQNQNAAPQYNQTYYYGGAPVQQKDSGTTTAAKVFMIIGTVVQGFYLIPLAWCIPMTVTYFNKVKNNQPISTAFKVCSLLFVSLIGGILMLTDDNH